MFGKLFVLVLVAVVVQTAPTTDNGEIEIQKLANLIAKAAREASQKLEEEMYEKVLTNASDNEHKVSTQNHDLLEQINKLKGEAEKQKVDIKTCLTEEEQLASTPKELSMKFATCNQDLFEKTAVAAKEEVKTIEESIDVVKKLSSELKACGQDNTCRTKVEVEVAQAEHDIPAKIEKAVDEIFQVNRELIPAAVKCVNDESSALFAKDQKIAKEIESCINSKIHH